MHIKPKQCKFWSSQHICMRDEGHGLRHTSSCLAALSLSVAHSKQGMRTPRFSKRHSPRFWYPETFFKTSVSFTH
jgi:hypothetical protein